MDRCFMIRKSANLRIIEILSPLQGWATFNDDSRADALRLILPPRWGGGIRRPRSGALQKFRERKVSAGGHIGRVRFASGPIH